jgi:DNA-binding GntR family transcriptional regulator
MMATEAVQRPKGELGGRGRGVGPRVNVGAMVPLRRTTLHEQVVSRIRDLIIDGTLQPGSRIVETDLGAQLGVSRTPLREALKTLSGEGLIDLQPSRGAVIHKSTADEARQMLEVLTGIESFAGRLACLRATVTEMAELRRKQDRMATFFANHRRMDYYKINIEIHTGFVALAHNAELAALHANYAGRVKRIRFSGSSTRDKWAEALHEHEQMMQALEARDPDRLAEVMRRHMGLIWERVRDTI